MDAAIIQVHPSAWGQKVLTPHSTVVGYKPIRLVTGRRTVDAIITEHSGFLMGTIPCNPGKEPLNAVYMFFNKQLKHGDSGCLVLDLEFLPQGKPRPYLIYLGVMNLALGEVQGYGLLIEQASRTWGFECYMEEIEN